MSKALTTALYDYSKINVHWFPQHMHIGMLKMRGILQRCYIPLSSASPLLGSLIKDKEHIIVFNKTDLSNPSVNNKLEEYAEKRWPGHSYMLTDGNQQCYKQLLHRIAFAIRALPDATRRRLLVVGIPNVGKSTIINRLRALGMQRGGKAVATGDKPGITRSVSGLVKLLEEPLVYMLDTPGILMPKIRDAEMGMKLAITGAISDSVLNDHLLADYVFHTLKAHDSTSYIKYFNIQTPVDDTLQLIEAICTASGWKEINLHNAVMKIMTAFRAGSLGKFTLDRIPEFVPREKKCEESD